MRILLTLTALMLPAALPAAPRLPPKLYFDLVQADAYRALVGPEELAKTELKVVFSVRGKRGMTYSVELFVEPDNTGEKAIWVRSTQVILEGPITDEFGVAKGEFKLRSRGPDESESLTRPHLPHSRLGWWSYCLVVTEKKHVVTQHGPLATAFVPKDVPTPE